MQFAGRSWQNRGLLVLRHVSGLGWPGLCHHIVLMGGGTLRLCGSSKFAHILRKHIYRQHMSNPLVEGNELQPK